MNIKDTSASHLIVFIHLSACVHTNMSCVCVCVCIDFLNPLTVLSVVATTFIFQTFNATGRTPRPATVVASFI